MLCVNGKVDESGQFRLPTFGEILGRRMKELGSGSFTEILALDVDKGNWSCSIWSYRTPVIGHQLRLGHDRPYKAVGLIRWWAILTILGVELGSPFLRVLVALCLSFPIRPTSFETES